MIERPVVRPQPFQQHQIFIDALPDDRMTDRTRFGIVVVQRLAEHPERQPTAAFRVEGRQLPCRHRRLDHTSPMRENDLERRSAVQRPGSNIHIGQQPGRFVDDDFLETDVLDQRQLCRGFREIVEKRHG
jgi:hypothetical protein